MSKFNEFAKSVRKIATSEAVLAQLKILEKEHNELEQQLKEANEVIEFYTDHTHVDYNTRKAREYKKKWSEKCSQK